MGGFGTVIVGLGHCGVRLHVPVLRRLRHTGHPLIGYDERELAALGLAPRIAGPGRVDAARCDDLVCSASRVPGMGGAWPSIEHGPGAHTEIHSDLTSPVRGHRVTLDIGDGPVVGHIPVSTDDPYSQLWTVDREVFHDDALASFFRRAHTHLSGGERLAALGLGRDLARLLGQAKHVASAVPV